MNSLRACFTLAAVVAASTSTMPNAAAAILSVEAANNATVQPGGPRSGGSGTAFFNIEGSSNGNFSSFGVADFSFGTVDPVTEIGSITLKLTQSNVNFTNDGTVIAYLDTSSSLVGIEPGTSPLAFDLTGGDPGTTKDVTDGDLTLLEFSGGPIAFTETMTGNVDSYTLGLTPAIEAELVSRLNAGDPIRVVLGTGDAAVAATWAGYTNSSFDGPTLVINTSVVPEPGSIALILCGLAAVAAFRRG